MFSQFTEVHKQLRNVFLWNSIPRIDDSNLKFDVLLNRFVVAFECIFHGLFELINVNMAWMFILILLEAFQISGYWLFVCEIQILLRLGSSHQSCNTSILLISLHIKYCVFRLYRYFHSILLRCRKIAELIQSDSICIAIIRFGLILNQLQHNFNISSIRSKFEGIRQEVKENLQIPVIITSQAHKEANLIIIILILHLDVLLRREVTQGIDCFLNNFMQVEVCGIEVKLTLLDFGKIKQVIDKIKQHRWTE